MQELFYIIIDKIKANLKKFLIYFLVFFVSLGQNVHILDISNATYINKNNISGDFVINNDLNEIFSTGVTLNMSISGATQMKFGNTISERNSASFESYSGTKSWSINTGTGIKTVYSTFRNADLQTVDVSDEVILKEYETLPYTTDLTLHFDASDSGSVVVDGLDNVQSWNDKSGNGYNAVQSVVANQPVYMADAEQSTSVIDFLGNLEYLAIENLSYTGGSMIDGLLTCAVFKTPNTAGGNNWAFIDFDRSDKFNFFSRDDGVGFSFNAGGIIDNYAVGGGYDDNAWHVSCASYDNTLANDTLISIDGNIEINTNNTATGAQIGNTSTRFGFIGDGSEASTFDGSRNNIYYEGRMGEVIYFDQAVSNTNRKKIECYLGEKWGVEVVGCTDYKPIATIEYSPKETTFGYVTATLTGESESITITNNAGSNSHLFKDNGSFTFEFQDINGNTGSTTATVDWIDETLPQISTGALNTAPIIQSYSGASSVNLIILSGATNITTVSAIDNYYNVVGEFGNSSLSGNTPSSFGTYEMCSPAVVVSHRQPNNAQVQRAPRVTSKSSTGFTALVDNFDSTIGSINTSIDYIVFNSGSHSIDGLNLQAGNQLTTNVACNANNNPGSNIVNFSPAFSSLPVVLHTIASNTDSSWVVSGVNGNDGTRQSEPTVTKMGTILQRSFNSCTHSNETVDYIAFEPGHNTMTEGFEIDTVRSTDSIVGASAGGNAINFNTAFSSTPPTVLVSQLGEDGGNGGYAMVHTGTSVSASQVFAVIDEDGPGADRNHTTEIVSSVAFSTASGVFTEVNTITYSLSGADAGEFNITSTGGVLTLSGGKDPSNPTDANLDGIYEVDVIVCDSHCNSKCSTQSFSVDVSDDTPPIITDSFPKEDDLYPSGNFDITFDYNDTHSGAVGVNTGSYNITLQKFDSGTGSYGPDISGTHINFIGSTISTTGATFPTSNLGYGKYLMNFEISDFNGNKSSTGVTFYIDEPEFTINTGSLDIGNLQTGVAGFSSGELIITVKTVGAPFDVILNKNIPLTNSGTTIPDWDTVDGFGYDTSPYSSTISTINTNEIIFTNTGSINTSGDKNTYLYNLKLGALAEEIQKAGGYTGSIDIGVDLDY